MMVKRLWVLLFWLAILPVTSFGSHRDGQGRLQDGTFTSLTEALKKPEAVEILDLNRQRLQTVPAEVLKFPNLKELRLTFATIFEVS